MQLININLFAEGYYSGSTYEENRWLKVDSYQKIKADLPEEVFCGELDGKHSEVAGDVEVQDSFGNEDDLKEFGDSICDGDTLRYELIDIYNSNGLDYKTEEKEIEEYLRTLDRYINVTVSIPQSQKESLNNFVDKLRHLKG